MTNTLTTLTLAGMLLFSAAQSRAEEPLHAEVLVEGARVQAGTPVIATLRKGDIYRIAEVRPGWLRIYPGVDREKSGYVRAAEVKLLPGSAGGPGQNGLVPETFVAARITVDWTAKTFGLSAPLPAAAGSAALAVVAPEGIDPAIVPRAKLNGMNLELLGSVEGLVACLAPGTRSVWVRGTGEQPLAYRIDLPPLAALADVESQTFPNFPEGMVLKVAVTGLLPGFIVDFAEVGSGPPLYRSVSPTKGAVPRLADAGPRPAGKPGMFIRLIVPYLTKETTSRFYYLRVRNPDGSTTQHLMLERKGDKFTAVAKLVGTATIAPVDSTVPTPDLELLDAAEAQKQVRAAGLIPTLVARGTLAELAAPPAGATIVRQGAPVGSRLLAGTNLWLTVDAGSELPLRIEVPQQPEPIDAGESLAFAKVASTRDAGSIPVEEGDLPEDTNASAALIALDVDPGLALDAKRPAQSEARAALLKQLLAAMARQPRGEALPGPVGQALMSGAAAAEEQFTQAVDDGRDVDVLAGRELLLAVLTALEIKLSRDEAQTLLADWSRYVAGRRTTAWLDRNANGQLSDDSAAWAIVWLFEQGKFDPWRVTTIVPDPAGGPPLASFPGQPQDPPDGLNNGIDLQALLGLLLPGKPNVIVPPSPQSPTKPPKPPTPPVGKPLVSFGDTPDYVRVPATAPDLIRIAEPRFRDLGLKIGRQNELFQSDKIVGSTPESRTWVPYASTVELDVRRLVPNVVKQSYADASATLGKWKLRPATAGPAASGEVVVAQSPPEGEYVVPGSEVELGLRVITPSVVGQRQDNAVTALRGVNLDWRADTKAFGNDQVVAQEPVAGELVDRGDRILLTLRLIVPDIRGKTLANARRILADYDLEPEVLNRLAHEEDIVRGQSPAPNTYAAHGSAARLGPITTTIPDIVGGSVGPTAQRLRNQEDFDVRLYGDLIDDDEITGQTPRAGTEVERGTTITLDARVRVPNVEGERIFAGRNAVQAAPGRLEVVFDVEPGDGDLVYGQDPQANTLVFPRSRVVLIPGVRVPQLYDLTPNDAGNALANAGLQVGRESSSTRETANQAIVGRSFVTDQNPRPGLYRRDRVQAVDLAYSTYVLGMRTVPSMEGGDLEDILIGQGIDRVVAEDLVPIIYFQRRKLTYNEWRGYVLQRVAAAALTNQRVLIYATGTDPPAGTQVVVGSEVVIFAREAEFK